MADRRGGANEEPGLRVLGIDEAGRGSVLGPLVVGAFCLPAGQLEELKGRGIRDSKRLTARHRESLYEFLRGAGEWRSEAVSPTEIDRAVEKHALNRLEAEAFARLVRAIRPDRTIVDACDPNALRFGRLVQRLAENASRVHAYHHADRDYVIVGAASIIAKVERDRAIKALERELARPIGSGYPSDPKTITIVRELVERGERPPWLRASWATVERVKVPRPARTLDRFQR